MVFAILAGQVPTTSRREGEQTLSAKYQGPDDYILEDAVCFRLPGITFAAPQPSCYLLFPHYLLSPQKELHWPA